MKRLRNMTDAEREEIQGELDQQMADPLTTSGGKICDNCAYVHVKGREGLVCGECGGHYEVEGGVAHHLLDDGDIDHETDASHTPYSLPPAGRVALSNRSAQAGPWNKDSGKTKKVNKCIECGKNFTVDGRGWKWHVTAGGQEDPVADTDHVATGPDEKFHVRISSVATQSKHHDLLARFPFLDCPALSEVAEKLNPDPKKYYAGRNLLQDALQQGCPVTEDPWLDAVAQYDGRTIKVNPERIKNASDVKIQAVLVHEVVHLLRDRLAGAKPGGEDEKPVLERDGERMALKAEAQFLMDNGLGQLEAEESVVGSLPEDLQKAARAIFDEVWAPKEAPETPVDAPEPVPAPSSQEA